MIRKTIIILILGCIGGAGFFLSEGEIGDGFAFFSSKDDTEVKKKNLVKPKSYYSSRKHKVADFNYERLSFFPVLNDPSMTKMMGLNGQVIKKIHYSPPRATRPEKKIRKQPSVPVTPVKIEKKILKTPSTAPIPATPEKIVVESGEESRKEPMRSVSQILEKFPILSSQGDSRSSGLQGESKSSPSIIDAGLLKVTENPSSEKMSFVVQVSSFRKVQDAETLRDALGKKGYASFIGKKELPNKGTWYRVNIGSYQDHAGAERAAGEYYRTENRKAMVIRNAG